MRRGPHAQNQYAPMAGLPALREAIAAKVADYYGRTVDPETRHHRDLRRHGSAVLRDPGGRAPRRRGRAARSRRTTRTSPPSRWRAATRCTCRCGGPTSPSTGKRVRDAITRAHAAAHRQLSAQPERRGARARGPRHTGGRAARHARAWCWPTKSTSTWCSTAARHQSLLTHDELAERSFVVSSFGKTFHATGWKVGYCIAPAAADGRVPQGAPVRAVRGRDAAAGGHRRFPASNARSTRASCRRSTRRKRDHFARLLRRHALPLRAGGEHVFPARRLFRRSATLPDTEFARDLTVRHGVAAIPISVFSAEPPPGERIVRFCFAKHEATLSAAAAKLRKL